MPFRIIYSSEAVPGLTAAEIEQMLAESRVRNAARGISGALVLVDGVFLQILEGEKDAVLELMGRIEQDPRHRAIKVFHEQEVEQRAFESWSMAYLSPSPDEVSRWAALEGATTLGGIVASVERNPDRLPGVIRQIFSAIASR
jgi:hypothetical protein